MCSFKTFFGDEVKHTFLWALSIFITACSEQVEVEPRVKIVEKDKIVYKDRIEYLAVVNEVFGNLKFSDAVKDVIVPAYRLNSSDTTLHHFIFL